jgi:hypothetical protein
MCVGGGVAPLVLRCYTCGRTRLPTSVELLPLRVHLDDVENVLQVASSGEPYSWNGSAMGS